MRGFFPFSTTFFPANRPLAFKPDKANLKGSANPTDKTDMTGISSQFELLNKAIHFTEVNHQVISQNIANVNTPNYRTLELSFEQLLQQIEGNPPAGDGELKPVQAPGLNTRSDGNNVDLDRELAQLKKNSLSHQTLLQLAGAKMRVIQQAIRG